MVSLSVLRHCVVGAASFACAVSTLVELLRISLRHHVCCSSNNHSAGVPYPTGQPTNAGKSALVCDRIPMIFQTNNLIRSLPPPCPHQLAQKLRSGVRLGFGVSGSIVAACLPATNKDDLILISRVWHTSERGYQSLLSRDR